MKQSFLLRICIVITILLGVNYIAWRWIFSVNWHAWWIAIPLVLAETYNLADVIFFGLTVWRSQSQTALPPTPLAVLTFDVFLTTYNWPIELVIDNASTPLVIRSPHTP